MPPHYEPYAPWLRDGVQCCQHCGHVPGVHHRDTRCYSAAEMAGRLLVAQPTGRWPGPDEDVDAPPGGPTVPL